MAATTPRQGGPRLLHPDPALGAALAAEAAWGGSPRAPAAPRPSAATLSDTGSGAAGAGRPFEAGRQRGGQTSPWAEGASQAEAAASTLLVQQAAQIIKGLN